jgi:hypothetical protein
MKAERGLPIAESIKRLKGQTGFSPISFYDICKFVGAWQNGMLNQHGKWLESSIANGLCFSEIETMLQHLTLNNLHDDKATFNINQIGQIFIVLKVMADRYKVYMVTSLQMEQYKSEDSGIPPNTPYLDNNGSII